jgi:hypothetical protein
MSEAIFGFPVTYKGANVSFVKQMTRQNQNQIYCGCIQRQYKKFVTAENNPHISNAQRVSQILSSGAALGGKTLFGNANNYRKPKYDALSAITTPTIRPIRNKF